MNAFFDSKVIIVTGAASGMGSAATRELRQLGATVYAADRNERDLLGICGETGAQPHVIDVSRVEHCDGIVSKAVSEQGKLDGVVNFAGVIKRTGLLECTDEEFDFVMDVNVKGCFYLCRAAARVMKEQGSGSIVNISSIWSDIAAAGVFGYCVSKGAVSQITRSAALDLAGSGVRVNEVRPGETNTAMLASERGRTLSKREIDEKLREIAVSIPEKRLAAPSEIVNAAIFLLSDKSSYMQGASITVDGAYTTC
ncbi:MAG: SDR family oxidoreductase [Hyphomicrobiaceae bacterium]|nr:SDR family oxidoreductase [Hyphomicrobiaceae bacterium]